MATGLTAQAKGDASSTSLKEAQKEKAALEKQLKAAKELINDLKDSKGDVEDKVQELNNELVDISSKITSLENQLADKSTEIADAEAELAQAEADKQKQYDDMTNSTYTLNESFMSYDRHRQYELDQQRLAEQQIANDIADANCRAQQEANALAEEGNAIADKARRDANIAAVVGAVQRHNTNKYLKGGRK